MCIMCNCTGTWLALLAQLRKTLVKFGYFGPKQGGTESAKNQNFLIFKFAQKVHFN